MSTVPRYTPRYTVEDYQSWKGEWELWDGFAIAMTPSPFGRHQAILVALAAELRASAKAQRCDATVLVELDWIVRPDTVVRPDLVVVCGRGPEEYLRSPPELVAEILSPSTRQNDLTFKRQLYADQGVANYLIVDADNRSVEQLNLGDAATYQSLPPADVLTFNVCDKCVVSIEVASMFD